MAFVDTRALSVKEPLPGWEGRYFHSEAMTFGYYRVKAGASIHPHRHANEEVWHVLEGELEVTIAGETCVAGPGCAAIVPRGVEHAVRAVTDARAVVVDQPRRSSVGEAGTEE